MSPLEISNWVSIYLATALCCTFAITLTTGSLIAEMIQERFWRQPWTRARVVLFVPRTWWRWQRRYFLSTPVTLGIVGSFAASLNC
jgi:hypothetical protein